MRILTIFSGKALTVFALLCFLGSFLIVPGIAIAQTQKFSGTVKDEQGNPLSLVSVTIKGTGKGTASNSGGQFLLDAEPGNTLIFSLVNHETVSIKVANRTTLSVILKEKRQEIDSVVVIGYGTARKKDLTGSVASVKLNEQEKTPVLGVEQLLEGRVSGVQVSQNQSQPGAVFSIRIRGTNSINSGSGPLFVVDGYAGGNAGGLNPSDILSIDVLKDASATAIYGSRGANGVVIITTKRGSSNGPKVIVDAYTGFQKVGKQYKMMNARQYGDFMNTLQTEKNELLNTSAPIPYTQAGLDTLGAGTDWQKEIFRSAPISNYSVSFNGGNAESKHYLSFNFFDQGGIIKGSQYRKGTIRYNIDQQVSSKVKFGMSSQIGYNYQNLTTVNTSGGSTQASVLWDAVRFNPILAPRDNTGEYTYVNHGPSGLVSPLGNPIAYINEAKDGIYNLSVFANFYGEYEIIKGLKFKSSIGANYTSAGREGFLPTYLFVASGIGSATQSSGRYYEWLNENTLTYSKEIDRNNFIDLSGGFTFQHWYNKSFNTGITNLSTNILGSDNLGIGIPSSPSSHFEENVLASYFGRANYRLMDKYLFTVTMRADGSSRFGANSKWGYFPSGAFAWRLSQENFMKSVRSISDLKVRASYGVTGNQEIGNYNSLSQYGSNQYSLGSTPSLVVGLSPINIPNPNLKWESTASSDFGVDLGLWENRIYVTADIYYKKTSNLLLNINIPETSGYTTTLVNAGSVSNKGFEFSLTSRNIEHSNIKWSTTLNFSTNVNKVISVSTNKHIFAGELSASVFNGGGGYSGILTPGKPIGSFYGYVFDGIWQSKDQITKSGTKDAVNPGDPIFRDLDGDSLTTGNDRKIIGQALPKFIYGITNNLSIGRFNLNVFFQGVYGNKILNENLYEIQNGDPTFNKLAYVGKDSWHGAGTSNTLPAVSSTLRRALGVTSDVLENGSFLRLKTVTLSYNLPLPEITHVFKTANIYVTAQNLVTFTKYSGYDPEVNSFTDGNSLSLGTDYNAYPNYRTYLIGVKLGF
ncbi:SusC/RagA family TonB-linked outer membrane protein [Flavitalea flava]